MDRICKIHIFGLCIISTATTGSLNVQSLDLFKVATLFGPWWHPSGRKTEGHLVGYETDLECMEVALGLRISSLSTQVSCVDLKKKWVY